MKLQKNGWGLPGETLKDSKTKQLKPVELAPGKVFTHYELAITNLNLGERGFWILLFFLFLQLFLLFIWYYR